MRGGPEALQKGDEDRLNQILGLRTSTVQPLRWAEPDLFEENHCRESPTFCNPFYSPSLLQVVILEQVVQQDILLYIFASVIYQLSSVSEPKTMSPYVSGTWTSQGRVPGVRDTVSAAADVSRTSWAVM